MLLCLSGNITRWGWSNLQQQQQKLSGPQECNCIIKHKELWIWSPADPWQMPFASHPALAGMGIRLMLLSNEQDVIWDTALERSSASSLGTIHQQGTIQTSSSPVTVTKYAVQKAKKVCICKLRCLSPIQFLNTTIPSAACSPFCFLASETDFLLLFHQTTAQLLFCRLRLTLCGVQGPQV